MGCSEAFDPNPLTSSKGLRILILFALFDIFAQTTVLSHFG